jgi:hypothetical protein
MSVTYELLETFTGTRVNEMPDPDNEGQATEVTQENVRDIKVRFTCTDSGCVHERSVNVVFDSEGNYDNDATLERCGEVARGVKAKMECGAIVAPE